MIAHIDRPAPDNRDGDPQDPPLRFRPMTTPILILAAGSSSRMHGRDKLLEPVNGIPLLRDRAETALATGHPVSVALRSLEDTRATALNGLPVSRLHCPDAAEGFSGTLRNAVTAMPRARRLMLLLADLPDLTTEDLNTVLKASDDRPDYAIWRGATDSGKPGHPIVISDQVRPGFAALSGDSGGKAALAPFADATCLIPLPGSHALNDLDTPEDWAAWRARRPD
ncbi:NTP transferase domain-containing protein [Aestuariibius sp. 2305UL40-4]|uniref:nucleotidyltransferase family protein n=1 Tax=Aestuariibius violaceus TaxID=3234132 RepID=UPI00345E364D